MTDQVSDQLAASLDSSVGEQELIEPMQEVVLEEEKVKDEIDIQIDLLKDPDWVVRREAAITLGEMGDERCVEPLAAALRDGDWQVREVAIEGIGQIGSPAVDVLLKLLRDWDVRKSAIMALGKIRDERVLEPLMQQLRNDEFMEDATDALVHLGEPALPGLIKALKDKEELVRKQAVIALGRIKSPEAIDPLIEMLQNKDWFTRLTAAAALEAIGDERGREAIKPLLKDTDMVVKMRVERILAKWKKQPAAVS
ncbi:MAG: HEAT repeat domain-containing protein [Nitrospira sp.]|nr:HEAT repeat domain-containing protein [Nitrospira sp.]MBX3370826.1 HEAT repeat domain-containing protein [Nitrospira sp.]